MGIMLREFSSILFNCEKVIHTDYMVRSCEEFHLLSVVFQSRIFPQMLILNQIILGLRFSKRFLSNTSGAFTF